MPAKDFQQYRRFYSKCPFGPVRGDLQAWLIADHVWRGWHGKSKSLTDSCLWFGGKRKKKAAPVKRGTVGRDWVASLEAAGVKVQRLKPGKESGTH